MYWRTRVRVGDSPVVGVMVGGVGDGVLGVGVAVAVAMVDGVSLPRTDTSGGSSEQPVSPVRLAMVSPAIRIGMREFLPPPTVSPPAAGCNRQCIDRTHSVPDRRPETVLLSNYRLVR